MPSEDRRAPPPVTRAGRKAAASEKRPRGRPRKDGVGGRAGPPPPPPLSKSRKKGRSRGQAQVEDEEGVDTTGKTQTAEVTSGRRGATSRRRSNAVPETPPAQPPAPLAPSPTSASEEKTPLTDPVAPHAPPRGPDAAPAEAEPGGASPGSSPGRSPHLRLEDDDAPSPLLRRSMSEDSGSPTPSLGHTERRLQQCALCYRGERPPLGQGPLVVFGPTPGYVPLHVLSRRTSSDRDGDCHDHCYPLGHTVRTKSSSPAECYDESSSELVEQLGAMGLPHDIDVQSLFDPTGQCCAHLQCAAWSEGVRRGEGHSLLYVDQAIDSASAQACAFCGGLGASLRCRETGCVLSYHFPCAAAAGAHQDWERRRMLCIRHAHAAARSCVACSRADDTGGLLMCCCCGNHYHAGCLVPPLNPSSLIRAGWQCAPCRACQSCRRQEDTSVLLVCARCDKAYHAHCLMPPLDHTPHRKWTCQNCRVCLRCGVRSSGHWGNHPFLCVSCDPALPCIVCGHNPDLYSPQDYVTCVCCYRCVHTLCVSVEVGVGLTTCDGKSYVCAACQPQRAEIVRSPAREVRLTPTRVPDVQRPTEDLPVSTATRSPVLLSGSERAQTTAEITGPSQENPAPSSTDAAELRQSPTPSPCPSEQRLSLVLSPFDPTELQQTPTSSPYSNEQKLSLVLSPSDPSELQQSPASLPPSPTELKQSPQSSPSHPTEPQQRLSLEQTPTYAPEGPRLSPCDPTELLQSPESSPSNTAKFRLSPTQSPSSPTDPHPSPEKCPSNSTVLRQSPVASPTNLTVFPLSPGPYSLSHAELHQSPSHGTEPQKGLAISPFNPTQIGESPPQYLSELTDLQLLDSHPAKLRLHLAPFPSKSTDVQQSPISSFSNATDLQQSPIPSNTTDLHLSPTPSPSNVKELNLSPVPSSPMPNLLQQYPTPSPCSSTELQQSPIPDPGVADFQHSPTPCPSNVTESHLCPILSKPKSTDFPQSPESSPNIKDLHPSPAQSPRNVTALHPSPLPFPSATENRQSPTPSPFKITQLQPSPMLSPPNRTDLHLSLVPSPNVTRLQQSPLPSPTDVDEVLPCPVPSPSNVTEIQPCPTPSPEFTQPHQSPVSSSSKLTELRQNRVISSNNVTELHRSPVSCSLNITDLQQSPTPSLSNVTEIAHRTSPLSPIQDLQQSLNVIMIHQSPVPSPSNTVLHQSAVPSPSNITELHQSPVPSPLNNADLQQSLMASPSIVTEITHRTAPLSPIIQDQQQSLNVTVLHQTPVLSPSNITEPHQSPVPSPSIVTELQSPVPSPTILGLHQSPVPSPTISALYQSPVPYSDIAELHPSPVPSPSDTNERQQIPVTSPTVTVLHQSPVPSPDITALHQSPVPSLSDFNERHQSPVPSPSSVTELHQSPVPSSTITVLHQSPIPSPNMTELHQCHVPSPSVVSEHHQSPVPSASDITDLHQSPVPSPNITDLHQSPVPSPNITDLHQIPVPSASDINERQQSPVPSPTITVLHQSPVPSPTITVLRQSPVSSPNIPSPSDINELHQSPVSFLSNVTALYQSAASPFKVTELPQSPVPFHSNITKLHHDTVTSPSNITELRQSPLPAPSDILKLHQSLSTSPSNVSELPQRPLASLSVSTVLPQSAVPALSFVTKLKLSPAISTELLLSPVPSTSVNAELHQSPVSLPSKATEQTQNSKSSALAPLLDEPSAKETQQLTAPSYPWEADLVQKSIPQSPACPAELVASIETANLQECPAPSRLGPSQFEKDPQVYDVCWEYKEKCGRSPVPQFCSTAPSLPSLSLDTPQSTIILTSEPSRLSPPSRPSVDSSGEKIAITASPKSPLRDIPTRELSSCELEGDEAKPESISPDGRLQEGGPQLVSPHGTAEEPPVLLTHQARCNPEPHEGTLPPQSPALDVETAQSPESNCFPRIARGFEQAVSSARRPRSAPSSPSRAPLSSTPCSLSQPVSPAPTPCTQPAGPLGLRALARQSVAPPTLSQDGGSAELSSGNAAQNLNVDAHPLESVVCSSTSPTHSRQQSGPSSPLSVLPAPASPVHQSASVDRSTVSLGTEEDVPGRQSDCLERAGGSGAGPAIPLPTSCDSKTDVMDRAGSKHFAPGTGPSSPPGSSAMLTERYCQTPANLSSLDAIPPQTEVNYPCQLSHFETGICSPDGCAPDPELPQLPPSGRPGPEPSPTRCGPSHRSRVSPAPIDKGLGNICSEASVSSRNQRLTRSSGSPNPTQTAGACGGSVHSGPEADAWVVSPGPDSLGFDSGSVWSPDPSWKKQTSSESDRPSGWPPASQASPPHLRAFPAPLSPLNDRAASGPARERARTPEMGRPRETQTTAANCSPLVSPSQSDHARIARSRSQSEPAVGSAVHTAILAETGLGPADPASAALSEEKSTIVGTTDQEKAILLQQDHPGKTGVDVQREEEHKHPMEAEHTGRCEEKKEARNHLERNHKELRGSDAHRSAGEPAIASHFLSGLQMPSSPSPPLSHADVYSEASPPLSAAPDTPLEWQREDSSRSGRMPEAGEGVGPFRAGSSERDASTLDLVASRPSQEEARGSSSDGEGEPSLDAEVMKLMGSASPLASPRRPSALSPPPLNTRSLRPPPRPLPPSDELSIRLRQSPFSTEASPETSPVRVPVTPPPLSPPSPPLSFSPPYRESLPLCKTPPATVIPLTRKIGMGKPAISKRKFSPGRARARQGSWWSSARAVSPPSSSQDSMGEGGRDSPKSRQADSPLWSMRAGRGSGFPGRRRSRGGGGVGGGRGGRGRSRVKTQDFVAVSPAYGFVESVPPKEEEENSMHNTVVMFSTSDVFTLRQDMCVVCGSFGRGAEGRLLACSQCGQCYHPYCVNVKVTRVILTKGWRCLECTVCEACGEASDPGRLLLCDDCDISYHTYCLDPPLHTVPKGAWKCKWCVWCVQCGSASPGLRCDWQSNYSRCGPCASLTCCSLCQRAYAQDDLILQCQQCDRWVHALCEGLTTEDEAEVTADEGFDCSLCRTHSRVPFGRPDNLDMAQILSRSREADARTYSQDGVCLTESGLSQLQSLVEPLASARRYRRCKPKLKLRIINQNSVSVLQTPPHPDSGHLECELKSDSSPERELAPEDDVCKDMAKRKRKPYRPGIGGFMVRQRGGKAAAGGKRSSEALQGDEDGAEHAADKVKKRYRKKKTKLEEAFPSYLQEAFFGRDLLCRTRQVDQKVLSNAARINPSGAVDQKGPASLGKPMNAKQENLSLSDMASLDLCDVLITHPHVVAGGNAAGRDISSMTREPMLTSEQTGSSRQGPKALQEEPLDAILNPELDKMVTDGALLSKLYKIPELEGKDVEDLFTAVLSPDGSQQYSQYVHAATGARTHMVGAGVFPLLNGLAGSAPDSEAAPGGRIGGSAPSQTPPGQQASEGEHDSMSTAQRSMLKWEKEEALGEQATVAPVLYCNTNFPQLREQYPEWSTRVKQIAKLWRKASSQDRAPYVQRARDNRAAQRITKVQMCGDPIKRTAPCPPAPYDAVCPDRDPLRPRESEQEQEWKLRQGEVKDRWRAGKKRQENTDKDCPFQASLAGGGKEALQLRQKSKQLAKMEASQKLEQVKNEQQRQQQQLSANQRPDASPDSRPRHNLLQGSAMADDVFLRPQAPPPSGYSSLPHSPRSPHSSSPLQQPPSSPQMFSPPPSRPASPWDPYGKPAGTPRPAAVQRCPSLSISPAHDASGSPAPSPNYKASDSSRTLAPQPGPQHSSTAMKSPPSGSQVYHRSLVQGGLFKAPMPPQNQMQQDLFGSMAPGVRSLSQSQDPAFHSRLDSPQRGPYPPAPAGVPRPDYSQQMAEHFPQLSSMPDAFANPPDAGPRREGSYLPDRLPALRLDHLKTGSGRRPSPSHPAPDPCPALAERFPRSPGGTQISDPYGKGPGGPRPSPESYARQASSPEPPGAPDSFGPTQVESSTPRLRRSPPGGETQSPGGASQRHSFARTPKHPGISAAVSGPSPTDKAAADDAAAVAAASSEGPIGLLPQLGDSEEKLRQRQKLRQLILRQQQQKSALRQEKGLREARSSPVTPGTSPTPSHPWPRDAGDLSPTEAFGRPPPPYPGTPRLPGPVGVHPGTFAVGQPRGSGPQAPPFPVQRGTPLRLGPQDSFPRPPPEPDAPVQMRTPLPGELMPIRSAAGAGPGPGLHLHVLPAAPPQAFPVPRALPVQQHSIMGQPYIELRHRPPENRLRLPFSLAAGLASGPPATRPGESAAGPPVLLMVQLNQQEQHSLVQATLTQGNDAAEGMEEQLEGVESAVKDLEDVEVKDLVDLNLNLDPEDGKEDLDLGPNDLHLDDFLLSGKFDLIAYADPELNLEDKKDMFNEELDLGDSVGDPRKGAPRKMDNYPDLMNHAKTENEESGLAVLQNRSAPLPPLSHPRNLPGPDEALRPAFGPETAGSNQPGSSLYLPKGQPVCGSEMLPEAQIQGMVPSCALTPAPDPQAAFQQSASGPSPTYLVPHSPAAPRAPAPQGPDLLPLRLPPPCPTVAPAPGREVSAQGQARERGRIPNKGKPLLLEEQPLLLQDLLDQERQEQQQQKQMQALIRHKSSSEPGLADLDFESISDPIMKAKMVALKGINKVMSQGNLGLNNMVVNRFHQAPGAGAAAAEVPSRPLLQVGQDANLNPQLARPNPPSFGPGFVDDSQRRQYEEWLGETQRLLQMQQRLLEEQLAAHRKTKKALSAKQRTAKRAGRAPAEDDAAQLRYVVEQQAAVQKQLEQIRKQQKDHTALIEDYRSKRQQQQKCPATGLPQNTAPLQGDVQNVHPAWAPSTGPSATGFASGIRGRAGGHAADLSTPAPQVKFDDNNPFSEGFQERERRERLREQQERHRVQLLQGVERQQQRPPDPGGGRPAADALCQMPLFSPELPQDFLQSPAAGGQAGAPFPSPRQGSAGGQLAHRAGVSPERAGVSPVSPPGPQAQPRPVGSPAQLCPPDPLPTPPGQAARGHPSDGDPASSSPSAALRAPFASAALPRLYVDVLANRDGGARTPSSSARSDDVAGPAPTDASLSARARGGARPADSGLPPSALAPSSELERQLAVRSPARERGLLCGSCTEVKEEPGILVEAQFASPLHDPGKELLRHLLKEKASPEKMASPGACRRPSGESARSEDEDGAGFPPDVPDPSARKKPQRCKRAARPDNVGRCKRRRHDEEDAPDRSSPPTERLVTRFAQLSALPLMEPISGLDLSLFPPYGSSSLGRDSRLSGSFGNACLDGVADYYAQLACKSILSNPPTPPASLPPTPPPPAKQKLLNGFATAEEVSGEDGQSGDGLAAVKNQAFRRADVDVPASLPTPPHNNQEELRARDASPPASPDGFVPSSSPESADDAEVSRYPDMSFVKTESLSPCPSPSIPIMPCSWGKGAALKREVKMEPERPPSCSASDAVTVAIALSPGASQNVPGVIATLAKLLRVPASIHYRLSLHPPAQASASGGQQRAAPPAGARTGPLQRGGAPTVSRPPSCSFCKVLLGSGVRKIKESKEEGSSALLFCSQNCSALYSSGPKEEVPRGVPERARHGATGDDNGVSVSRPQPAAPPPPSHRYANNMSSIAVHSLPPAPARAAAGDSPPPRFPSASAVTSETKPRPDCLKVTVKLKPRPHAFSEGDDSPASQRGKRAKSSRWRRWNVSVALSRGPVSDEAAAAPADEEVDALLKRLGACLRPDPLPADQRRCCFCHQQGDGETDGPARLLNLDLDLWVHLNCALWSSEVYETQAGALINVELALRRGLTLRCAHCQQTGATSGCNRLRCANTYHFTCAVRARCTFFKDKTMLCQLHRPRAGSPPAEPRAWLRDPYDSELRCFAVFRRVYVQRDEARQVAAMVQRGERHHSFRVGSLLFCAVGRLLPCQMAAFHDAAAIFPVGYHANRIYWSMRHSNRRCEYMCSIEERDARPLFKVKVVEDGYEDLLLTAPTPKGVWEQILEPVARLRSASGTLKLFPDFLKGEDLFGLSASAVCRIVESLPGVEACERYTFRYGRNPLMEWPLAFNPSGSARSEPKAGQAKRPYLLTGVAPRCQGSVGSVVGAVPGVISLSPGEAVAAAHQGRHSKLAQYRRMKADWKTNVYLARSRIQGLGLYAARDIEKCTMVIEYIGAIIRSEVANRKERLYESQNRGVYMFRIDNDYVIDATIAGGPARYINHSCAPNCITEVVSVEKENKIIISSCRRIQRGEELCYDYKFDLEDDQHKIPCHCGAFNCRKWMN